MANRSSRIRCLSTPEWNGQGVLYSALHVHPQDLVFPNARGSVLDAGKFQVMRISRRSNVTLEANASDASISLRMKNEPRIAMLVGKIGPLGTQGASSGGRAATANKSNPHACFAGPIPLVTALTAFLADRANIVVHSKSFR